MSEASDGSYLPVLHASKARVVDRGEEVWVMLCTDRPVSDDTSEVVGDAWVVFPRSGFVALLVAAVAKLMPGVRATCATSCEGKALH